MGASLLDDVLAETLDPAYAQAARGPRPRGRSGRQRPSAGAASAGAWWR